MTPLGQKRQGYILSFTTTALGSFLLHSFLLICHPYPPSFSTNFSLWLLRNGSAIITHACAKRRIRMRISAGKPRDKAMASFRRQCCRLVDLYLGVFYWKVQRFCWPKGTSLECAESIYVKTTETACVSDELCRLKEEEEEEFKRFAYIA